MQTSMMALVFANMVVELFVKKPPVHLKPRRGLRTLQEVQDLHELASGSSLFDSSDTFYGNSSSSLIDHLFAPQVLIDALRSSGPLVDMSKRLQLIKRRFLAEHLFVHCFFYFVRPGVRHFGKIISPMASISPACAEVRWDMDSQMRCLREGDPRRRIILALEVSMEAFIESEAKELVLENTPDSFFQKIDEVITTTAKRYFELGAKTDLLEVESLKIKRLQLLETRRTMKQTMVDACNDETFQQVVLELDDLTKRCKALKRKEAHVKRDSLIDELWDH